MSLVEGLLWCESEFFKAGSSLDHQTLGFQITPPLSHSRQVYRQ